MYAMTVNPDKQLVWTEHRPVPLAAGQVRIAIRASAVNRADLVQREGHYPPPTGASDILGLECAGVVSEVADDVDMAIGSKVCALLSAGGYATEVVCDACQVIPIPAGVSLTESAALPEAFATAWFNLYRLAGLKAGENVLIKAAGSGVGTAAIQLSRALGSTVFVQVGSDKKLHSCLQLGASAGTNRHKQSQESLADMGPFDVILDPVTGSGLEDTLGLLKLDGRLLVIGLMAGARSSLNIGQLLMKRLHIIGSTLRPQPPALKGQIMADLLKKVWPLINEGTIKPVVDKRMAMRDAANAFDYLESNNSFGKILLLNE